LGTLVTPQTSTSNVTVIDAYESLNSENGTVPLIDWSYIEVWNNSDIDTIRKFEADSYFSTTKKHSERAYALRVAGDSMQNSNGIRPTYFHDDVIIVDPSQTATNLDRVIALLNDDSIPIERRIVFKQLIEDGPAKYLRSLNDSYRDITAPFTVIGKIINVISE